MVVALQGGPRASFAASVTLRVVAPTVNVAFYGDSFTRSAQPYLTPNFSTQTASVRIYTYPGSAPCDFAPIVYATTRATAPVAVVFQFDGNGFTACMKQYYAKNSSVGLFQATANKYVSDLTAYEHFLAALGTKYFLFDMGPVASSASTPNASSPVLLTAYGTLVHSFKNSDVLYATGADNSVLTGAKKYTRTLPCLVVEVSAGNCSGPSVRGVPSNYVRSPDGRHFCPVDQAAANGVIPYCPLYSSGNYRFAGALAALLFRWIPTARPVYPTPIVARMSATSGSANSSHVLTLYGDNLAHATSVLFRTNRSGGTSGGNYHGTQLHILSNTELQITTPVINLKSLDVTRLTLSVSVSSPDSTSAYLALLSLQFVAT